MKKNLPKKTAAKAVKSESVAKKTTKPTPATKVAPAKSAPAKAAPTKPAAAKAAPKVKPAAKTEPKAKPLVAAKPAAPKAKKSTAPSAKGSSLLPVTTFVAQVETGWGNSLYLRGEGAPELSWERGILMKWEDGSWVYSTTGAKVPVAFKFLINDQIWAEGHNQHVEPGATSITTPHFHH